MEERDHFDFFSPLAGSQSPLKSVNSRNRSSLDRVSVSMTIDSEDKESKLRHYHNVTGPGDYNMPSLTGKQILEATKTNAPRFSFASK
jgi:hypothetical protein